MKLGSTLLSLVAARGSLFGDAPTDERIWVADTTLEQEFILTESNLEATYDLPQNPATGKYYTDQYVRLSAKAPEGYAVRAKFTNFAVESGNWKGECKNDAVILFDGPDGNNFIKDYCGKNKARTKPDVVSSQEELTVVFKSNENTIVDKGFTVTFVAEKLPAKQFAMNRIVKSFGETQSIVFTKHGHKKNQKLIYKKAQHMQRIFERFAFVFDRTSDSCSSFAGTGDENDFIPPVITDSDPCGSVTSLMTSLGSFWNAFACLDGYDPKTDDVKYMLYRYQDKVDIQIERLRTKKFNQMCNK